MDLMARISAPCHAFIARHLHIQCCRYQHRLRDGVKRRPSHDMSIDVLEDVEKVGYMYVMETRCATCVGSHQ